MMKSGVNILCYDSNSQKKPKKDLGKLSTFPK